MTDEEEIIFKAIEKAEKNSGELIGWLLGAVFDDLPSLQTFAKALWGEHQEPLYNQHNAPAYRKGFKPWDNEFGIDYGDWSGIPEELHKCANNCSKRITRANCRDNCQLLVKHNKGWEQHLMAMVISENPIKYLADNIDI